MKRLSWALLALGFVFATDAALAGPVQTRILEDLRVSQAGDEWTVVVALSFPTRVLRHAPVAQGHELLVFVELLALSPQDFEAALRREGLRIPTTARPLLRSLTFDGERAEGPLIELRFAREVSFEVESGHDLRSLTIHARPIAGATPGAKSQQRLEDGRAAIARGEYDLAISYLTRIAATPGDPHSAEALELLGVAREKNGQFAHAKAEYESYLARYPDGEGAERVQQRLRAMLTAHSRPKPQRREERSSAWETGLDLSLDGSFSLTYQRAAQLVEDEGEVLNRSALFTDVHVTGRASTQNYSLRGRFSGRFGEDFLEGRELRISSAFGQLADRVRGIEATAGRQSRSTGGVLGRFDGGHLSVQLPAGFRLHGTAGWVVDSSSDLEMDPDRHFYGLSLDLPRIAQSLDVQLFAIRQMSDGLTDRFAVGSELRYVGPKSFAAFFLDFDVHFGELNTAYFLANWTPRPRLQLSLLADHRTSPILLARSALSGQTVDDLGDLLNTLSEEDIYEVARDRTARATNLALSGTYRLSDRFQLASDLSIANTTGTSESLGVSGSDGTGWELSPSIQLVGSDLFLRGDLLVTTFRHRHDRFAETITASLLGRIPVFDSIRIGPSVRMDFRMPKDGDDLLTIRPLLRFDYRFMQFTVDTELGFEWRRTFASDETSDLGYHLTVNLRRDF